MCRGIGREVLAIALSCLTMVSVSAEESIEPPQVAPVHAVTVKAVRVEGNTLLRQKDISAAAEKLVGSDQSMANLRRGVATIQELYRKAGYGGVVVYLPEQDLTAGEIIIRVVEGKLAVVNIKGNAKFDDANIRRSLPYLKEGETPSVRAIDRDIQLANENPAKEVQVKLKAGSKPGEIDADITVVEDRPLRVLLGAENTGTPASGEYRTSVGLQHANLWNRDHVGTVQYQTSPSEPSLVKIYSVGYKAPIYGYSSDIDLFYAHSTVSNGTTITPAGSLQFTGTGDVAGLKLNRYLERLGEYDHRVFFGVDWRRYDNECTLGAFGSAGCGTAAASVAVLPLSLGYTGQMQHQTSSWGVSFSVASNVSGSKQADFEAARPGAPRYYQVYRASAFGGSSLPKGFGIQARLTAQYSPDPLISGEQLGIGGAGTVRGYRERELAGDSGAIVNLEFLGPDWGKSMKLENLSLRVLIFADEGWVSNHNDTVCLRTRTSCSLTSAGVGLRIAMGRWLSGRLDVGHAFEDGTQRSAGSNRGHVAINLVF